MTNLYDTKGFEAASEYILDLFKHKKIDDTAVAGYTVALCQDNRDKNKGLALVATAYFEIIHMFLDTADPNNTNNPYTIEEANGYLNMLCFMCYKAGLRAEDITKIQATTKTEARKQGTHPDEYNRVIEALESLKNLLTTLQEFENALLNDDEEADDWPEVPTYFMA